MWPRLYRFLFCLSQVVAVSPAPAEEPAAVNRLDVAFELRVLDETIRLPWLKAAGDLDGDGRPDLVVGSADRDGLIVFLNRSPQWERQVLNDQRQFGTDGEVADLDGDGRQDIVAIARAPEEVIVWYRNLASGWSESVVTEGPWHDIEVADLDGDGLPDIIGRHQKEFARGADTGNRIHLRWQRRAGEEITWDTDELECPAGEGLLVTDLDGDGDSDIVINRCWFENLGGRRWKKHDYATEATWSNPNTFIAVGDVNADGRPDLIVVPAERARSRHHVSWFEAPADPRSGPWTAHVIEQEVESVLHFVGAADFDGDARVDIVTAEMTQGADPDEVMLYLNRGEWREGRWVDSWEPHRISDEGSHSMRILDADGDGRPDLFGANWKANGRDEHVKLWLNRIAPRKAAN